MLDGRSAAFRIRQRRGQRAKEKQMKEKWIIGFYGASGDGYVDYENKPTNNLDNCMSFDTEKDCLEAIAKLQPEWSSKLSADKIEIQMYLKTKDPLAGKKTTEDIMNLFGVQRTTATNWASKNGVESVILPSGKAGFAWTDDDIEKFKNRPKRGRRWN